MSLRAAWILAVGMLASGCITTTSKLDDIRPEPQTPPTSPVLAWEVENRFRLIAGEAEEKRFYRYLSAYIEEYDEWFVKERRAGSLANDLNSDLLHTGRLPLVRRRDGERIRGDNFATNYNTRETSYRCRRSGPLAANPLKDAGCKPTGAGEVSWVTDPGRRVRLSVAAWSGHKCEWIVGDAPAAPGDCDDHVIETSLSDTKRVTARLVDSGAEVSEDVTVEDIKVVALGDSFSAGEGNPHSQWRLFSMRFRPAYWLDPRCHRSLISGPSLAAAYLARRSPHTSVTLLHYGCSGASVADGVANPWPHLETSGAVAEKWGRYALIGVRQPIDQQTKAITSASIKAPARVGTLPIDYPPSQIEQALIDLDGQSPDVVLMSVGGNDVGFGDIVAGLSTRDWKPDLIPEYLAEKPARDKPGEKRVVTSFDQAAWVGAAQAASPRACLSDAWNETDCVVGHVLQRIGDPNATTANLGSQFGVLSTALQPLLGGETKRMFITSYPNFVQYWAGDLTERTPVGPEAQIKPCDDQPLDHRPGFVPGVVTLFSDWEMRRQDTEKVDNFLLPLNGAIRDAAKRYDWNWVNQQVADGRGHGYCSLDRWYNTVVDSFWSQGQRPTAKRPLGNFRVVSATNLRIRNSNQWLQRGDGVVWSIGADWRSPDDDCFVLYDGPTSATWTGKERCVEEVDAHGGVASPIFHDTERVFQKQPKTPGMRLVAEPGWSKGSVFDTSGPVHPNLFGHCNYAASLVTAITTSDLVGEKLGRDPATAAKDAPRPTVEDVCSAKAWGYVLPNKLTLETDRRRHVHGVE